MRNALGEISGYGFTPYGTVDALGVQDQYGFGDLVIITDNLLLESGDEFLLEDGAYILLEG